jgi:hypothetical protein
MLHNNNLMILFILMLAFILIGLGGLASSWRARRQARR